MRAHVRSRLPLQYMPHHFVYLSALPLTTQGKVDREALPRFSGAGLDGLDDANEHGAIAAEPDARDHEGGDSLGAMRVAAEVSDVLSIDIHGTDAAEATSYWVDRFPSNLEASPDQVAAVTQARRRHNLNNHL